MALADLVLNISLVSKPSTKLKPRIALNLGLILALIILMAPY